MKIAVIGGAGVRVPLLVHGLTHSDLPVAEITLFDTDLARLDVIASLARTRAGHGVIVRATRSLQDCLHDAAFVFVSIRVGGIGQRARDERICVEHDCLGQETVGPAGFAMAWRTIPAAMRYAEAIQSIAPRAWIINFTNPVGIITQAMQHVAGSRVIGICDTPTELFEDVAHVLELDSRRCHFDYLGINHLGWLREVYHDGEPQLTRLWNQPERLGQVYRTQLFPASQLLSLRLLPTEYVYYYYRPEEAKRNIARQSTTRGAVVQQLNEKLFSELHHAPDAVATYEAYLQKRDATYMQIESGSASARRVSPWASLTGYDKIALNTARALHFHTQDEIPLNVRNDGNLACLQDDDVVEAPCIVGQNGALPLHVAHMANVPESVRELLVQVKTYERHTMHAAQCRTPEAAVNALASHPLVENESLAHRLVQALLFADSADLVGSSTEPGQRAE